MNEIKENLKKVLSDIYNQNVCDNVESLLLSTNKERNNLPSELLKPIIKSLYLYNKEQTESNMLAMKDSVIPLYNYMLEGTC